ncbi:MAG: metallophosphoesterase [Hyphomonadaceae bacterium]|nr:metallophosphoesterase [Hyphomonadaceae bacterium]
MKLLLVSDLHYALKQFDWTASVAPGFDAVIIAGDHLDIAGQLDGGVQIVVILKYLRRLAALSKVIVSSGNHDLDRRDAGGEKIASWMSKVRQLGIPTDGDSVAFGDTLVTVCPWWDGPTARDSVHELLARDAAKPRKQWIWVYHAPPEGPLSWDGKKHHGDAALNAWIETHRPDIVLTGHIHQAPFKQGGSWCDRMGDTWIFNSGRQIGPTPTHVAIDTRAREAAWFSLAGAELVKLDDALVARTELTGPPAWLGASAEKREAALG